MSRIRVIRVKIRVIRVAMDFTKLWDKTYLFGPNPLAFSRSDLIFFWASIGFVILGIIAKLLTLRLKGPKRLLLNRLFNLFFTMGILILIWAGARYENIPWFSTHIVVLVLFLLWFVWSIFISKYLLFKFRRELKNWQDEQLKFKYLNKK